MKAQGRRSRPGSVLDELRLRLEEAEQTLEAIRAGEVDSLVVDGPGGLRVYTLEGAGNVYRVIMEAMSEGAATLTETGVVLYANGRLARMVDQPLQRVMGASLRELVAPGRRRELDALLRAAHERESRTELELVTSRGELVPVLLSATAVAADGRPSLCLVATDLREQKRSEAMMAAEQLSRSVLEQAADAIVVCDDTGRIVRASAAASDLCGGDPLLSAFAASLPVRLEGAPDGPVALALQGEAFRGRAATLSREGRPRIELLVSGAPLRAPDGRTVGCVVTLVDVSELRAAEEALRRADAAKNRFLATLSHELRNPLAPIRNSVNVLEHAAPGSGPARRAQEVLGRQVKQLSRLVDDLLDVTRIAHDRVELHRERLDLDALVRSTVDDHLFLFEARGVTLEVRGAGAPVMVDGDRERLAQVVGNLLHNAAKFTRAGGRTSVVVSVDGSRRRALVTVSDDGEGIPAEVLPSIFEPFVQADDTLARSRGGLGLGLALVKGLIELHGGSVAARSDGPTKGSELGFELPLAVPRAESPRADTAGPAPAPPRRVLVIEDNVDAADSLREVLELAGHEVAVAYGGPDGVARACELHPDVVLCDIGLPGMNGYEVARAVRSRLGPATPVLVALSGYALPEDVARSRTAGFSRHLAKPLRLEELEEVLGRSEER